MLGEARVQLGRQVAHRPIDIVRAISRLGTARGVTEFARFGYLERNGQSNLAVPLGRVTVTARPRTHLIDDIAPWMDRIQRLARDKGSPARIVQGERRLGDAVFAVLTHDDTPQRWQAVLLAALTVESVELSGTGFKAGPIPPLSPEWVHAADDGSVEWRLARALGSAAGSYSKMQIPHDSVRHHWLPLQTGARRFLEKEKRLMRDVRTVMTGRDAVADFAAIVERRLIEAAQRGERQLPLVAFHGCDAHPSDIAAFIQGGVDVERVSMLSRALMAVRWDRWKRLTEGEPQGSRLPDEAWMALRLTCLPWAIAENQTILSDPVIVRRLIAGDSATAVEIALRRLRSGGMRPPLLAACADERTARLWAAALAFPISYRWARRMARRFAPPTREEIV